MASERTGKDVPGDREEKVKCPVGQLVSTWGTEQLYSET